MFVSLARFLNWNSCWKKILFYVSGGVLTKLLGKFQNGGQKPEQKLLFLLRCIGLRFNLTLPILCTDQHTRWSNCLEQYTEWSFDKKRKRHLIFVRECSFRINYITIHLNGFFLQCTNFQCSVARFQSFFRFRTFS